ncbi:hypothetical protein BLNAU_19966 [Blattamonas nauphoetae]|uniref:Uncharacterized protein n=1 Tax=Blattamonas nauphoetae TaxID=2049346 RepID=A0ABQ9X2F5_9EUKA|nr:hypothetical protein BLNAU_19966 [Blattamonas nauphoetae]
MKRHSSSNCISRKDAMFVLKTSPILYAFTHVTTEGTTTSTHPALVSRGNEPETRHDENSSQFPRKHG